MSWKPDEPSVEKVFVCHCHGEGMRITKFDDMPLIFVNLWIDRGMMPSFVMRLRSAYRAIRWGSDVGEITLTKETAKAIANQLLELAEQPEIEDGPRPKPDGESTGLSHQVNQTTDLI